MNSKILLQPPSLGRQQQSSLKSLPIGIKTEEVTLWDGGQRISVEITSFISRVIMVSPPRIYLVAKQL